MKVLELLCIGFLNMSISDLIQQMKDMQKTMKDILRGQAKMEEKINLLLPSGLTMEGPLTRNEISEKHAIVFPLHTKDELNHVNIILERHLNDEHAEIWSDLVSKEYF